MGKTVERKQPVVWITPVQENEFIPPVTFPNEVYLLVGFFTEKKKKKL